MDLDFKRGNPMTDTFKETTDAYDFRDISKDYRDLFDKSSGAPVMDPAANFSGRSYIKLAQESLSDKTKQ